MYFDDEQNPYRQTLPFYEQAQSSDKQITSDGKSNGNASNTQTASSSQQPLVPMTPSSPPRKEPSPWLVGAVIAGLIVLVGGSMLYLASYSAGQAQIHTEATATAQPLQAAALAQANATATATAVVDPHIPAVASVTLAIDDPLTRPGSWSSSTGCQFQTDGYHVSSLATRVGACYEPAFYTNSSFQVGVKLLEGSCVGLGTRIHGPDFSGYVAVVCNSNTYTIAFFNNRAQTILDTGMVTVFPAAPDQENILTFVTNERTLEFYVNGTELASVTDSQYVGPGQLGLIVGNDGTSGSEAVFDHAVVWTF